MHMYRAIPPYLACHTQRSMMPFLPKNAGDGGDGVVLEVTVLAAESLRFPPSTYSLLPRRLRPYVTVSSSASASASRTAVAGTADHSWNDTLLVPVDADFLESRADVDVAVLSEGGCRLVSPTPLGWCSIPASDVLDGLRPPGALRRLSYSLRCPRFGAGGRGILHLAVRMLGEGVERLATTPAAPAAQPGWCRVAMGIPVPASAAVAAGGMVGMPWAWGGASR